MKLFNKLRWFLWKISMRGLPRGPHITRYYMYERLMALGARLPIKEGRVLSISHSANLVDLLGVKPTEIVDANYPDHNILSLGFADNSFDFVLSDQVFEHIEGNPQQAVDECYRILRPGGIAIHTTCFINPVHGVPKDFWRFTPDALTLLHKKWSSIIESDGWGNFDVWSVINIGLRWEGVPHAKWHPFHRLAVKNDPLWPITTWVLARK